jgi:hypothetical protein
LSILVPCAAEACTYQKRICCSRSTSSKRRGRVWMLALGGALARPPHQDSSTTCP